MLENAIRIFSDLLNQNRSTEDIETILLSNPVLLWPAIWPRFETHIAALPNNHQRSAYNLLGYIRFIQNSLLGGRYPTEYGPLDDIDKKFRNAEITLDTGISLATSSDCFNRLSPFYVNSRCDQQKAHKVRKRAELLSQFAYLERMAHSTAKIKPPISVDEEFLGMISAPVITAVELAIPILIEIPDGKILDRCLKLYQGLCQNPFSSPENPFLPELHYAMGRMYLDSYFSGRELSIIEMLHENWIKRYYAQPAVDRYVPVNMPTCIEACDKAIFYLEMAEKEIAEKYKGTVKSALDNAQYCRKILTEKHSDKPPPWEESGKNDENAASSLDDSASVENYCASSPLIRPAPKELIERFGQPRLFVMLHNEIALYLQQNPHISYEVYKKGQEVLDLFPDENLQEQHFQVGTRILFALAIPAIKLQQEADVQEHMRLFTAFNSTTGLFPVDYFSNIITIATLDIRNAHAGPGPIMLFNVIEKIKELEQPLELIPLCQYAFALSFFQNGNRHNQKREYLNAVNAYSAGLAVALDYGFTKKIKTLIANMADTGTKGDDETYIQTIIKLAELLPLFAKKGLSYLDENVNHAFRKLLTKGADNIKRANMVFMLTSMAKGFHFRSMIENGSNLSFMLDDHARSLLNQIKGLFEKSDIKFSSIGHTAFNQETLIGAYISNTAKIPGDGEFARFTNLRIEFDDYVQKRRFESLPGYPSYLTVDDVRSRMDADTVFINYFLGETNVGYMGIYTHIITTTHNEIALCVLSDIPMEPDYIVDGEAVITASPLAPLVSAIRNKIMLNPTTGDTIHHEAYIILEELGRILFSGNIPSTLSKLWEGGKRKLCVWPHSTFHYVPFHLLPYKEGLLSDYWSIKIIPDISLLAPNAINKVAEEHFSIMAMSFTNANPFNLGVLEEGLLHSDRLASMFNTTATVDAQLTKSAFIKNLKQSGWAHLYTHGYLTANAPLFQSLFLHPDSDDDGIFYAHELIGLDLSNIDLLTLSACTTGVGRFDVLDNLRGLTANFFIAGVSTIIATLWESETDSSAHFFEYFYACLKNGMSKLDAYTEAQKNTRMNFPQERDWGAFFYLGR